MKIEHWNHNSKNLYFFLPLHAPKIKQSKALKRSSFFAFLSFKYHAHSHESHEHITESYTQILVQKKSSKTWKKSVSCTSENFLFSLCDEKLKRNKLTHRASEKT